ncbi:ORF38L [Rana nigromaculata ranavirus]|uniref:ORF38L n=1 Tax=Rana nigromaculata ranavirus TaxID=2044919 RepID=A0A2P1GJP5_FRG3V|nr:ORF38L [Rana nigromaculata ranavirus]
MQSLHISEDISRCTNIYRRSLFSQTFPIGLWDRWEKTYGLFCSIELFLHKGAQSSPGSLYNLSHFRQHGVQPPVRRLRVAGHHSHSHNPAFGRVDGHIHPRVWPHLLHCAVGIRQCFKHSKSKHLQSLHLLPLEGNESLG